MLILGQCVDRDGGSRADRQVAERAAWQRFFAGPGGSRASRLALTDKLTDMGRCVWPAIGWRCSRWAATRTMLQELDVLQRTMMSIFVRIPRLAQEPAEDYVRRRGRAAASRCHAVGMWSDVAAQRMLTWDGHMRRGHSWSWATELIKHQDSIWLQARRAVRQSYSLLAGRTGTRSQVGRAATRWEDGIRAAQQ